MISLVPYGMYYRILPSLGRFLEVSETWTKGRANVDDIIAFLYSGQMRLWVVHDPHNMTAKGYLITEVKAYPRCKMLVLQYCAGDFGSLEEEGDEIFETFERFAKDTDCDGIEFFGRPGWKRHALNHGCTIQTVVYEKYFDEVKP
jgi:hypothetical protein